MEKENKVSESLKEEIDKTPTTELFEEAERRLAELESYEATETSQTIAKKIRISYNNKKSFVNWFCVVLDRLTEYEDSNYFNKENQKVNKIINSYKNLIDDISKELKDSEIKYYLYNAESYLQAMNKAAVYVYFIDKKKRIPRVLKVFGKVDKTSEKIHGIDLNEKSVTAIKDGIIKCGNSIIDLISSTDTYVSYGSGKRILRVLNIRYNSNGKIFYLDGESCGEKLEVSEKKITSIYKLIDNYQNTGMKAIVEIANALRINPYNIYEDISLSDNTHNKRNN